MFDSTFFRCGGALARTATILLALLTYASDANGQQRLVASSYG